MANPVTWFEIIGPDAKQIQKFYRDTFGWKMTPPTGEEMGFYSMLEDHAPGIGGGLGQGGPARISVYIEAADPQKLLDKAVANGAMMMMPVTTITADTTIAMFSDPAGNTVGLLKANPRAGAASTDASTRSASSSRTARPRAKAASRAKTGTSRARTRGTTAARKTSAKRATGASKRKKRR
ncbi:MAG TPA: VOC family protein [Candidatus Limnocylindrales bacterium]|nr:VOC family protein [Candidatus Limnocylindrales bacterium]